MRCSHARFLVALIIILIPFIGTHAVAQTDKAFVIDMTYAIPTFRQGDIARPDLNSPVKNSQTQ